MSLSHIRIDALSESSSNAPGTQVPTDTGDQIIMDVDQPAATSRNLSPSPDLKTPEGLIRYFHKRGAEIDENDERRKKLRQANTMKVPGKPAPSSAPPQRLHKRKASSDNAEESSKRQHVVPLISSGAAVKPATAAPATASEGKVSTSATRVQEDPILSPPKLDSWNSIRNPGRPLLCILQVNNGSRIGTFKKNPTRWAFQLTLDAGPRRDPVMFMDFFDQGVRGPQGGETSWLLNDYVEGDWMVRDFKIHRVADCAQDGEVCHREILASCKNDQERARLICISMESWPKVLSKFKDCFQKHLSPIFEGRIPYHIRIWFIAPKDLENFEKQCLSVFVRSFEERGLAYRDMRDANGVSFEDNLKAQQEVPSTQS